MIRGHANPPYFSVRIQSSGATGFASVRAATTPSTGKASGRQISPGQRSGNIDDRCAAVLLAIQSFEMPFRIS